MSLSYQGVEFSTGDRLLLSFEDREWIVFEVPSIWGGGGLPLDDTGFGILDEILFPDDVAVLSARDVGFSLEGIEQVEGVENLSMGAYALISQADGTLVKFKPSWTDDEGLYTSEVLGLDIVLDGESDWRLLGAWAKA